jgi:hypothetical protein
LGTTSKVSLTTDSSEEGEEEEDDVKFALLREEDEFVAEE